MDFGSKAWHLFDRLSGVRMEPGMQEARVPASQTRQMVPI